MQSMTRTRKQLTLFVNDPTGSIEKIRAECNPEQYHLIPAHITLCREDEIGPITKTLDRVQRILLKTPIRIEFKKAKRFANGNGVLLPSNGKNSEFVALRKSVLGQTILTKEQLPHITLMHPRNSTCTDELFEYIRQQKLPIALEFDKICLIEQKNGGKWTVLNEFYIA